MKRFSKIFLLLITLFLSLFVISCNNKPNVVIDGKSIHTELQSQFLADDYNKISIYAKGKAELSLPEPITIDLNTLESIENCIFVLSEDKDFKVETLNIKLEDRNLEIYNLKIQIPYYYKVVNSNDEVILNNSFIVNDNLIRNLYVDGVTNFRDLGGALTNDKNRIKQGLIYRSSKWTADDGTDPLITDKGKETIANVLKIKTELDLRETSDNENGGLTQSAVEGVNYISFPLKSGGNCLLLNKESLNDLFKILADESNYPLVFHCSIGTDRTGMVAFVIENLLGVSKDDVYRDYLFSNFGNINTSRTKSAIDNMYSTINSAKGDNNSEKMYNYLINNGVNKEYIDKVIEILK